jgi:hypothetical protein
VCEVIGLCFVSFGWFCNFVFQFYWLGNRRKGICGGGRCSGFLCGSSLVEVYELLIGVLSFFHCSIQVSELMYFDVAL